MLKLCLSISFATLTILIFYFNRPPEKNNAISLHIGKPYEDVCTSRLNISSKIQHRNAPNHPPSRGFNLDYQPSHCKV